VTRSQFLHSAVLHVIGGDTAAGKPWNVRDMLRDVQTLADEVEKVAPFEAEPKPMIDSALEAKLRATLDGATARMHGPREPVARACPECGSSDVTAAVRLPSGTWKCQICGAVWRKREAT
jgi:predicted RNA-binding Zn-ribbon protein involved in translation (DUF1610 family)